MTHPLKTTVEDFVAGLCSMERDLITLHDVKRYCKEVPVSEEALEHYIYWRDDFYARNLIYRDDLFEVMAICWQPGQRTVPHTHNGQLGWMSVPRGQLVVENYKHMSCNAPERQNVVNIDCLGGATEIHLDRVGRFECTGSDHIATVDKLQTIHTIANQERERAISLHVYSKPFDSCIAFDLEHQRCFRRTLKYWSKYGRLEAENDNH